MQKLLSGLQHFQSHVFQSHKELFERLALGQNPDALFITCSDSRINPNLITQTNPGDIFILRNAGNIIPPYGTDNGGEVATIEFAVAGLGVKDVILCGHSQCGAMKGLLHPEDLKNLPAVMRWLSHAEATRRIVEQNYSSEGLDQDQLLNVATQVNVLIQLENLKTHPSVAVKLSRGELNLHGWIYKIQTGEVFGYDQQEGQFLPVSEVSNASNKQQRRLSGTGVI